MNNRIVDHPILGKLGERKTVSFTFNGKKYEGLKGDTIASALMAHGIRTLRVHEETGTPRGIYCNIGHCFECRVTVNGAEGIRACMTPISADLEVVSGGIEAAPLKPELEPFPRTYAEFEQLQEEDSDE